MGKKLDALLGRGFKTRKFKAIVNHTISRLAVIRRQHQARCSVARSDVMQILQLGQHQRALLRVEQVVQEQNLLDVFTMLELYCYLLIEKVMLLQDENYCRECPEELKEAMSSMIYASTRCGQLPELQELRAVFTSRFGKEFEACAIQQRNNCNVNPKMIQKLSTSIPCMAIKLEVLEGIAQESNIVLQIDVADSVHSEVKSNNKDDPPVAERSNSSGDSEPRIGEPIVTEDEGLQDRFSDKTKMMEMYEDGAQMADAASLPGGALAADTAKAAMELSWFDSDDSIYLRRHRLRPSNVADSAETTEEEYSRVKELNAREAVHPLQTYYSESEDDKVHTGNKLDMITQHEKESYLERSLSTSSIGSADMTLNDESLKEGPQGKVIFDDSDYDIVNGGSLLLFKEHIAYSNCNHTLHTTKILSSYEIVEGKII